MMPSLISFSTDDWDHIEHKSSSAKKVRLLTTFLPIEREKYKLNRCFPCGELTNVKIDDEENWRRWTSLTGFLVSHNFVDRCVKWLLLRPHKLMYIWSRIPNIYASKCAVWRFGRKKHTRRDGMEWNNKVNAKNTKSNGTGFEKWEMNLYPSPKT